MSEIRQIRWLGVVAAAAMALCAASATAAVGADEAAALGKTLTGVGAEAAASKDGQIPAYAGGLKAAPADYKPGSGKYVDPFKDDKPVVTITAANFNDYADRLTEGSKELFKRNPTYKMVIYPTRRTVGYPKFWLDGTTKNALSAKLSADGNKVEGAWNGVPFPIPKTGKEVVWNHLMAFREPAVNINARSWYVDPGGSPVLTSQLDITYRNPYFDPDEAPGPLFGQSFIRIKAPSRLAGNDSIQWEALDTNSGGRKSWAYLPGQRRVRATPDNDYDTPSNTAGGVSYYDDSSLFYGTPDRFEFKLVGKKELYIPYNTYTLLYQTPAAKALTPRFLEPEAVRWELHRVWVIEGTLKDGLQHGYGKRVLYFDEDTWAGGASDNFDRNGKLFRSFFAPVLMLYDQPVMGPGNRSFWGYDFSSNVYTLQVHMGDPDLSYRQTDKKPASYFTSANLAGQGVR